ncbi:MAG: NUDIX hydrolase [Desulfobacteraceae bacterium]|nr:NUDIX hydrolase [Desulfobacteraceae bacterium]
MQIKNIQQITAMRHLNMFLVQYRDKVGKDKAWEFASRSEARNLQQQDHGRDQSDVVPDAVVVVPFHTQEKKLVIIKEFRVVLGGYQYGFPAGLLDPGENMEQAGTRELFEETGLTLTRVVRQSPAVYSSSGMTDESVCLLYAECEGTPSSAHTEDSEDIETQMLTREGAGRLLSTSDAMFDVKTWLVLQTFAVHGVL